jgi:hypothetical protein
MNGAKARTIHARLGSKVRYHPDDRDAIEALRRDLRAAQAEEYIERLVAVAPPLTDEQRARLAVILNPQAA